MTKTNRLLSLFAAMLFSATMMADVVYEPLEIASGFNRDVIAETTHIAYDDGCAWSPLYSLTSGDKHRSCSATKEVMVAINEKKQYSNFSDNDMIITERCGWPNNNSDTIRCDELVCTNDAYKDVKFLLGPYGGNNALCLRPEDGFQRTGTLHFKKIGCYNKLYFLMISLQQGGDKLNRRSNVRLYFTNGMTKDTTFNFGGLSASDATANKFRLTNIYEYGDFRKNTSVVTSSQVAFACVYDIDIPDSLLVDSIWFENPKINSSVSVYAVTGRTADVAAPAGESTEVADIQNHQFTISWDGVPEAETYRVDVATDEDFQHMVEGYNNQLVTKNDTIVTGLDEDEDYYWRVRAVNADGGQSASSAVRRVRTAGSNPPETSETSTDIEEMLKGYAGFRAVVPSIKIQRTLCRNGYFNTLCLPFSMNAEQIAASPIAGVRVFEFVSAEKHDGLDIVISGPIDHIDAGVPYLVNWVPTTPEWIGEDGLVFENVNITTYKGDTIGADDEVQFIGNIGIASMVELDQNNLFLGANNTLYYPENEEHETRLRGFRAYFLIPSTGSQAVARHTPARIVMHKQTPTDVEAIGEGTKGEWRKVLRDGHLIILRGDKEYNAQGQRVK